MQFIINLYGVEITASNVTGFIEAVTVVEYVYRADGLGWRRKSYKRPNESII